MTGAERDYPTLARMAAGGSEEAETAIEEIQQLRSRVRNLRAINDGLVDQLGKLARSWWETQP